MIDWLAPALGYVATVGALGIATKLALRTASWPELLIWTAMTYVAGALAAISQLLYFALAFLGNRD